MLSRSIRGLAFALLLVVGSVPLAENRDLILVEDGSRVVAIVTPKGMQESADEPEGNQDWW